MTTTDAGSVVGSGDLMRPNPAYYDILGADPYNYGCFRKEPITKSDGAISGGTTLQSATMSFKSTDTGKTITGTGIPAGTTVSYVNATTVTERVNLFEAGRSGFCCVG